MWSEEFMCRATLFLIGCFLLNLTNAGRFIELETNGKLSVTRTNDYGVPVTGYNKVLFEVKACSNAYVVLSREVNFKDKVGKYFFIMLGAGKKARMNGIKDSCIKCSTFNEHALKTTVKCDNYTSIFLKWDGKGSIQVGDGTDETNDRNIFLRYKSKSEFAINYINVLSNRNNASWRFRVDGEPKFTAPDGHGATVIQVPEDTAINKEIYAMKVLDPEDDNITFKLGDKHKDVFQVVGSSIMLAKPLDFETQSFYSISIKASDGFNTISVAMAIRVKDVNDEPPTLNYNDDVKVPEEMPVGYVISGLFSAIDKDTNDNMTFMLEGPESSYLNLSDNVLKVSQRIDHDGDNGHSALKGLTFRVFDSLNHESNITKNITIMDMNDNAPKFPRHVYEVNVTENSTKNIFLLQVSATDNDSGGNGAVVYSLAGENETTKYFQLNGSDLYVDGDQIDLELLPEDRDQLLLTVVAVDTPDFEQPQTGSATIRLKIISQNEYDPKWTSPKIENGSLPETTLSEEAVPLTTVVTVTATDEDRGDDGKITYSILSMKTGSGAEANKTFWMDSNTGELKTAALLDGDVNTGGEEYYDLTLMASDGGSPPHNVTANIRVRITNMNDNPPQFNNTVMEITLAKSLGRGDVVVSLVASDPDGDNITFSLDGQAKDLFEYDGKELKAAKRINQKNSYVLIMKASDGVHEVAATALIVGVDSKNSSFSGGGGGGGGGGEMLVEAIDGAEIPEEYPVGLGMPRVFTVLGGGKDNALSFSLSGADSSKFKIDSKTGVMSVKDNIDFESNATKVFDGLTVTVTDSDAISKTANITVKFVDVNDNQPKFNQPVLYVNATEGSSNDTLLTTLEYSDLDQGANGNVSLNISGDDSALFRLEGDKLYVDASRLDFENQTFTDHQQTVVIQAVDNPTSGQAKTGECLVVVKILPRNEHAPAWTKPVPDENGTFHNVSLTEVSTPLAEVGNFTATDQDGGDGGHVTYKITSAVSDTGESVIKSFAMNPETGVLVTTAHVDSGARKPSEYYDITVTAEDNGTPIKMTEGKIRIIVDVSRVVSPLLKTARYVAQYVGEIVETASVGDIVKNFTNVFPGSDNTNLTVTGKWNQTFEFDGLVLKTKEKLDYEQTRIYFVDIRLSDGSREETTVLTINVKDVSDDTPKITILSSYIPEELPPLSVVGSVFKVTDGDQNDVLTYNLTGSDSKYFNIDTSTGQLTMKGKLDRDGKDGVLFLDDLLLTVTDKSGLTANSSLNLTVLDMNDNSPYLSAALLNLNITENSTSDTVLTSLVCEDPDEGNNGNCSLELVSDLNTLFKLNGSDLTADGSAIDYESLSKQQYKYELIVALSDHPDGSTPRTSSATIQIQVRSCRKLSLVHPPSRVLRRFSRHFCFYFFVQVRS